MHTKEIARTTIEALDRGSYQASDGTTVDFAPLVKRCVDATTYHDPDALAQIRDQVLSQPAGTHDTVFEVVNETTLEGCTRLHAEGYQKIGALNFASARNPGGGFLSGAKAQEESLARSSALYKSQTRFFGFYEFHRKLRTTLYSDRMIYSPACPVFRTDDGEWMDAPLLVDFITSPAPNAGAIRSNEPENIPKIIPTLRERGGKVLALVLGAWGCGVFQNDPVQAAAMFHEYLRPGGQFAGRFRKVVFSVYDKSRSQDAIGAFTAQFR
jgi:uncharacterized protein (TIGR02452 family)